MAAAVRSSSFVLANSGGNLTIPKPTGTAAGDVLICVVWQDHDGTAGNLLTFSGWTQTGSDIPESGISPYGKVWWKVAGPSEPATYTPWVASSGASTVAFMMACTGVNPTTPIRTALVAGVGTGTASMPAVTGALAGDLWVGSVAAEGVSSITPTVAVTTNQNRASTWNVAALCSLPITVSGTSQTPARTATLGSGLSGNWRTFSMLLNGFVAEPIDLTDSGDGTDTATVAKTDNIDLVDSGAGSDLGTVFADWGAITDSAGTAELITVDQLTDVVITDTAVGTDSVEIANFIGKDLTDSGAGIDAITLDRINFVDLVDSGVGTDVSSLQQTRDLTDTASATDSITSLGMPSLLDSGAGVDEITIVDIPFTQVLPRRELTVYDAVVVARVPQSNAPPTFIEIDPIEWKSLSYTNTLSQPQELTVSCQISSCTEPVLQRLRNLDELATEIWLFRDGQVVFAGPLQGFQTSGETLTLTAKGLLAYLKMMVINADMAFKDADLFTVVKAMIDQWQVLDYGNFGIDTSNVGLSDQLLTETYLRNELHVVGQRVEELGKSAAGFDIEIDPTSRKLQLWAPTKGVDRSVGEDAIVLDARNITSGDILCSVAPGDLASEAYGTATAAGADTTLFSTKANLELRSRYGRTAVTGTWSDTSAQSALDNYTQGLLDARGQALLVPGPKIRVTVDADLGDYEVGDMVAYELGNQLSIGGAFRIRKQTVTASPTGQESVDLEFV